MGSTVYGLVQNVVDASVDAGYYGACVPLSIILKDLLISAGYFPEIINGLKIFNADKKACWHCWVRLNGHDIDISSIVMDALVQSDAYGPHMKDQDISGQLTEDWKIPCKRNDMDNKQDIERLVVNVQLLKTYNENPQDFWNNSSPRPVAFRDQVITKRIMSAMQRMQREATISAKKEQQQLRRSQKSSGINRKKSKKSGPDPVKQLDMQNRAIFAELNTLPNKTHDAFNKLCMRMQPDLLEITQPDT